MREPCTCAAMHSHDYPSVRAHCLQYFRPDGWEYSEAPPPVRRPALFLTGRCFLCGGSIDAGMPVPSACTEQGDRYHFLYHQLRTWRPYAIDGPSKEYPAALDRLDWYRMQDERTEDDWGRLLLQLLPEREHAAARLWLSGYGTRRSELNAEAWPVGAVARFKYELEVQVSAHIGTPGGKTVIVHPFQEMKVTKSVFRPGGIIYSGLVKADGETFYLDKVPDDKLYSQPEWSALLPERLADPFAIGGKRDFTPELPPAEPGRLCVLVRTLETGGRAVVKVLAAAPAEELLMGAISQDVARLAAQEVIPAGLPFETMTESDPHSPEMRCYRHYYHDSLGSVDYTIRTVPLLSATVNPPEGGAA